MWEVRNLSRCLFRFLTAWVSFMHAVSSKPGTSALRQVLYPLSHQGSLNQGLLIRPGSQGARVWQVFHKPEELGLQVTRLSAHGYLCAHSPWDPVESLPLKWSPAFIFPSGDSLGSRPG